MAELGVGVIGFGRVGGGHMTAAQRVAETTLVGMSDVAPERVKLATERFGCLGYPDYHDLLKRDDVQIVMIGLPHFLHVTVAEEAANAGKHMFVEKPMAMDVDECDRMIAACEKNHVKLMVGHSQHYNGWNLAAKRLIDSGEIGDVIFLTDSWYKPLGLESRPAWGMDRARGGGMLQMNGAHMIDRLRWFAGKKIVAVRGRVGNDIFRVQADDNFIGILEFDGGMLATIQHAAYLHGAEHYEAEVVGTRGMLKVAPYAPNTGLWLGRDGSYQLLEADAGDGMNGELRDLARAILDDGPPAIDGAYGREIVQAMSALEESTRTGRDVRFD